MADEYIITQEDLDKGSRYLQTLTTEHLVCRIADGVTEIDNMTFCNCSKLESITIPEGVTSIGDNAFNSCSNLTSVTIPEGVTSIGGWAFVNCKNLTSIIIPEGVTSIGNSAFDGCSKLESITIPEGVTSIGNSAFAGCSNLTSVTIPEGVTSIGDSTFNSCSNLTSVTIPDSVIEIVDSAFYNCTSLTSITIPDSVTSIGDWVFRDCTNLTSITIPDGVTSIGDNAFYNCSNLQTINVSPDFDQTILENVDIPSSAQIVVVEPEPQPEPEPAPIPPTPLSQTSYTGSELRQTLFNYDASIYTKIINDPDHDGVYADATNGTISIHNVTVTDGVLGAAFFAPWGETTLTEADLSGLINVTDISRSFVNVPALETIILPQMSPTDMTAAFEDCFLKTIDFSMVDLANVESASFVFNFCKQLETLILPTATWVVKNDADITGMFGNCRSITSLDLSNWDVSNVKYLRYMFSDCIGLTSLNLSNWNTSNAIDTTEMFLNCNNLRTIYINNNTDLSGILSAIPAGVIIRNTDSVEYNQADERLLVRGNERITRQLKVQGDVIQDANNVAVLPNIKSNSIELGNGVVRKIAKNAQSGVVTYDATNEKFVTGDDLEVPGDLVVDGQITVRRDVSISGDLYVNGTEHINDVETIQSSDDYFVLRHNKSTALGANEHAGIAVHNYALDKTATLTTDNQGIWRVADNSETSTTYTGVSYYNGDYFTGLTQTATTVIDGIKTAYDQDELDECALYNGSFYYHFDGINWYGVSLVNNVLTVGAKVEDAAVITALEALTRNDLVYYRSLTVTVINEVQNQPLLTRAEEADLNDGDILAWDETNKKAVHLPRPTLSNQTLKSKITNGVITYEWGNSGSAGVAFVGTRAQYNAARLIPEGQDGFIPPNSIVKITDEDDYVTGENR